MLYDPLYNRIMFQLLLLALLFLQLFFALFLFIIYWANTLFKINTYSFSSQQSHYLLENEKKIHQRKYEDRKHLHSQKARFSYFRELFFSAFKCFLRIRCSFFNKFFLMQKRRHFYTILATMENTHFPTKYSKVDVKWIYFVLECCFLRFWPESPLVSFISIMR